MHFITFLFKQIQHLIPTYLPGDVNGKCYKYCDKTTFHYGFAFLKSDRFCCHL